MYVCKKFHSSVLYFNNRSDEIFIKQEDRKIFNLDQEKIKKEAIAFLKKTCQSNVATVYKLGKLFCVLMTSINESNLL